MKLAAEETCYLNILMITSILAAYIIVSVVISVPKNARAVIVINDQYRKWYHNTSNNNSR